MRSGSLGCRLAISVQFLLRLLLMMRGVYRDGASPMVDRRFEVPLPCSVFFPSWSEDNRRACCFVTRNGTHWREESGCIVLFYSLADLQPFYVTCMD